MLLTYAGQQVRQHDPDRYLLSLFAPAKAREALWALFSFNHELAKTRSMVTNTQLGLIRLQWWRDEISRIYDGGDGGKVPELSTLAPRIHAQVFPQEWFDTLIYAREFDLEDVAPANLDGLKNYANFTTAPLNRIALKIIGEEAPEAEIAHISTNLGLLDLMRNVPFMLAEGRCFLPQDELQAKNLTAQKVISNNHKAEIIGIIDAVLSSFDSYRKPVSRFLALQQRMTFIYLRYIQKNGFDVFKPEAQLPPPFMAMRLALGLR